MLLLFCQTFCFLELNLDIQPEQTNSPFPLHTIYIWALFTLQFFYATGHLCDFNSLHWAAAFVGFEEMNVIGGGILMILETFSAPILFTLSLPLLIVWIRPNYKRFVF